MNMKIVILILLIAISIVIFSLIGYSVKLLFDKHTRNNCNALVEYTRQFAKDNLGFIRIISGPIRSGKTTMGSGLIHLDELNIIDMIDEDLSDVREIMHELDFSTIDKDIIEQYEVHRDRFLTFKFISKKYKENLDNMYYDNHLKVINYYQLLEKYIYAYFRNLDNNYVMSNVDKYSFITQSNAKLFKSEYMKIVESQQSPIIRYMTIFDDEKLLTEKTSNNIKSNFSNDGTSIYLRLLGQLGKEKIFYTTTAQNALRWVKSEREIATSIIYINSKQIIGDLPTFSRHLKKKKARNMKKMMRYAKRRFKAPEDYNAYLAKDNVFKIKNMELKAKLNKIFSESYIKYTCSIYRKIDDIGKTTKDANGAINFDFVFPVRWCFGSIDSHYFSFIQDYLEGYKKSSYYDLSDDAISPGKEQAKVILSKPIKDKDKKVKDNDKKEGSQNDKE